LAKLDIGTSLNSRIESYFSKNSDRELAIELKEILYPDNPKPKLLNYAPKK